MKRELKIIFIFLADKFAIILVKSTANFNVGVVLDPCQISGEASEDSWKIENILENLKIMKKKILTRPSTVASAKSSLAHISEKTNLSGNVIKLDGCER